MIETLGKEVPTWRESRPIVEGHLGEETPVHVSVKLSSLYSQIRAVAPQRAIDILAVRFGEILERAIAKNCAVTMDMEDSSMTSISIDLFKKILNESRFSGIDRCGIVLQVAKLLVFDLFQLALE